MNIVCYYGEKCSHKDILKEQLLKWNVNKENHLIVIVSQIEEQSAIDWAAELRPLFADVKVEVVFINAAQNDADMERFAQWGFLLASRVRFGTMDYFVSIHPFDAPIGNNWPATLREELGKTEKQILSIGEEGSERLRTIISTYPFLRSAPIKGRTFQLTSDILGMLYPVVKHHGTVSTDSKAIGQIKNLRNPVVEVEDKPMEDYQVQSIDGVREDYHPDNPAHPDHVATKPAPKKKAAKKASKKKTTRKRTK